MLYDLITQFLYRSFDLDSLTYFAKILSVIKKLQEQGFQVVKMSLRQESKAVFGIC